MVVVSDPDILNLTILFPGDKNKKYSIKDSHFFKVTLIRKTFSNYYQTINHFEISDSYCPDTFDLSINDHEFARLAQPRIKNTIAILIYISVNKNQVERGDLIKQFYKISQAELKLNYQFPQVRTESIAQFPIY